MREDRLMTTRDKLQLVVRSEKVSRVVEFEVPLMTLHGTVGVQKRRAIVSDYVLDERQRRAWSEAQELAEKLGLILVVTDLSRQSALRRVLALFLEKIKGDAAARAAPKLKEPLLGDSSHDSLPLAAAERILPCDASIVSNVRIFRMNDSNP